MRLTGRTFKHGLAAGVLIAVSATAVQAQADVDASGSLADDQSAPAALPDVVAAGATPAVMTGTPPTSYTTATASSDEMLTDISVPVITSTTAGDATLTGVVTDDATGAGVAAATVQLARSDGALTPKAVTTTNTDGVFAISNIPGGVRYNLTVTKSGFGTYKITNDSYAADTAYEVTVPLTAAAQTFDETSLASQGAQAAATSNSGLPSDYRVPPTITVGRYSQTQSCANGGTYYGATRYPWRFYVLHTATGEIDTRWSSPAWKSVAAAIQNYAWYFRQHPANSSWDVNNTTSYQCFRPEKKIPANSWRTWVGDILNERFAASDGSIKLTQYRAGSYSCSESSFPNNGNLLSQNGARALADNCGYSTWRSILNYYYTGSVDNVTVPPLPNTSWSQVSGGVKLNFPSQVKDASGAKYSVGWRYDVEAWMRIDNSTYQWVNVYNGGWKQSAHNVPTSFTYSTPDCWKYRVRVSNPAGWSQYAAFNGNLALCPG